jgi:hypothetical protein
MMSIRKEVCELANELAKKRGGQPHEYMGEAWETIRQKNGQDIKRKPIKIDKSRKHEFSTDEGFTRRRFSTDEDDDDDFEYPRKSRKKSFIKRKMKEVAKSSVRSTVNSLNFTKAPTDRPSTITSVFGGTFKKETDPIPKIPDSVKKMFKPW